MLSIWAAAAGDAECDQYMDALVPMTSFTLLQSWITADNHHRLLQEMWHTSLSFIIIGPGTDPGSPDDVKLLNWSSLLM